MGEYNNQNDPQTGDSNSAQNAGNATSQQGQQQQGSGGSTYGQGQTNSDGDALQDEATTGQSGAGYGDQGGQGATGMSGTGATGQQGQDGEFANDDESRGGPPTGEQVDDTGGLTSDEGARTGGMQQSDALGSAQGSELDEDEDSDTLEGQNSSGAV